MSAFVCAINDESKSTSSVILLSHYSYANEWRSFILHFDRQMEFIHRIFSVQPLLKIHNNLNSKLRFGQKFTLRMKQKSWHKHSWFPLEWDQKWLKEMWKKMTRASIIIDIRFLFAICEHVVVSPFYCLKLCRLMLSNLLYP